MIPVTMPELLRQLRGTVIPDPRRDRPHRDAWALWRRRHQYRVRLTRNSACQSLAPGWRPCLS
jgi:hypothetical protein